VEHPLSAVVSLLSTVTAILYYGLHMLPALPQARLMNCISCDLPGFRELNHILLKDHHRETIAGQSGAIGFDCLSVVGQKQICNTVMPVWRVSQSLLSPTHGKGLNRAGKTKIGSGVAQERGQVRCCQAIKLRVAEGDH